MNGIILQGDLSGLISAYKDVAAGLIGIGFIFAGVGVVKKIINHHDKMKEAIIGYVVALVVFILIWSLL